MNSDFQSPGQKSLDLGERYESRLRKEKQKQKKWWQPRMPHGKKQWIVTVLVALLLIGGGVGAYFAWLKDDPKPTKTTIKKQSKPASKPVVLTSNLTGMPIGNASVNDLPVTAIMIENSPDARPQSGIDQAGVIFEAIAEGGITRFLTLYQDTEPGYIGPVRSVRPYYVQWLHGFDAAVAHVGGSGEALQAIKDMGVKDLDQFHNAGAFWRISSRYAPHNMYTSIAKLREAENNRGYTKPTYTPFQRKAELPNASPTATSIDFAISGVTYNAHFDYDKATNSYLRSQAGKPHMVVNEAGDQKQLNPKVVIALAMPYGRNGIYSTYQTIGSGQALLFQDGVVAPINWSKSSNRENFVFTDANGAPVKLNPGQTWITALGSIDAATYR